MPTPPTVPVAIRSLSFLLPALALIQLALAALLFLGGAMSFKRPGDPATCASVVLGLVAVACALVGIVAIFILRRRSLAMRIVVTLACLISIGIATTVMLVILSAYSAGGTGGAGENVAAGLVTYSLPLLLVFGTHLAVLLVLWAAPSARAFFYVSSTRV